MSLSLIIVTHNEEKNIIDCLEPVYGLVDEIVVVDGESTDRTVEIIKDFDKQKKAKIYREKNHPNFIINKQKALEHATGEWVLELDADEIVSAELKREIQTVVSRSQPASLRGLSGSESVNLSSEDVLTGDARGGPPKTASSETMPFLGETGGRTRKSETQAKYGDEHVSDDRVAYWFLRLNHFLGAPLKKGGQFPDPTIRLYKREHAKFPGRSIHDQVDIDGITYPKSSLTVNDKLGKLSSPLLHYPYPNLQSYFRKWAQYSVYEGEDLYKKGVRPSRSNFFKYMILYPKWWFLLTFFRHRGYADGLAGFAFCLFSALRYCVAYCRLYELSKKA